MVDASMSHEGYVNEGDAVYGLQKIHRCASSLVAAQGKLTYSSESQVNPFESWGTWYDDGKHRHICNRTRSYTGWCEHSVRMTGKVPWSVPRLLCSNMRQEAFSLLFLA